jgi:F0F1-type ATP synthase assembly protein I
MAIDAGKMVRYASIGIEFSSPMVGGAIMGHYLDQYFKTDPYLTLAMFVLGMLAGFYRLITALSAFQKEQ